MVNGVVAQSAAFIDGIKVSAILTGPRQSIFIKLSGMNFIKLDAGAYSFWCFRRLDFHWVRLMFNLSDREGPI